MVKLGLFGSDAKKIKELEEKISELKVTCKTLESQVKTHEKLLIRSAKIFKAFDETLGPVCEHYRKELEKERKEDDSRMFG